MELRQTIPDDLFDAHTFSCRLNFKHTNIFWISTQNAIQSAEVDAMNYELQLLDSERLIKAGSSKIFSRS
ncbi:MAG: hypothetical protein MZV64_04425 [Ignavibacteriales bacterium]|nr:hypothetical protein [Ignavibacteriales bacterium]